MQEEKRAGLPFGRSVLATRFGSEWVSNNVKAIVTVIIAFFVTFFCLYQFTTKKKTEQRSVFTSADAAFDAWKSSDTLDIKALQALEKPLRAHPELQTKFGTAIAQRLLAFGEGKRAHPYANAALFRSGALLSPHYIAFSKNTLLISSGKYSESLENAEKLKEELLQDPSIWQARDRFARSGVILYAYNLLRIAALSRELNLPEKELKAWNEIIENAGWEGNPSDAKAHDGEAYALLAQNFSQGELSLLHYIQERKKELLNH